MRTDRSTTSENKRYVLKNDYKAAISLPAFEYITEAAEQIASDSYVIGGYVRDYILNREKSKDIDIVAVGSGIELASRVAELLPGAPKVQIFKT